MHENHLTTIARLQALLAATSLVHSEAQLGEVLAETARVISGTLSYRTVVVNLYRPAWNDFVVAAVHGSDRAARETLLGNAGSWEEWAPLLDDRFRRRGAYLVKAGEYDWADDLLSYTPNLEISDDPRAWHPDDALFVPLWHGEGRLLGIISVDEPLSGMRPSDGDLDVMVALAEHAAIALQSAQEAAQAGRHKLALEQLLQVSSRLTETLSVDAVLQSVVEGISRALGFDKVSIDLPDQSNGVLEPRSSHGWSAAELAQNTPLSTELLQGLLDPAFEIEGCYLLTSPQAAERLPAHHRAYRSVNNGIGPNAWNRHWLIVPLRDRDGATVGVIWADDPTDRLLPTSQLLQALRVFANQASAALDSAAHFEEVRFLAEHDALTRLLNRRAFTRQLGVETARSGRYHRPFSLALCDLDGFKQLNDRRGHQAGDAALEAIGEILRGSVRRSDFAFRIGGDEFALILPETDDDEVRAVVDRIGGRLEADHGARLEGLRASFGVSVFPRDGRDPEQLYRAADEAMYGAKRAGMRLRFAV